MRIIAGKFRSRHLHTARGLALRPTSDRLRETLFDILQARIEDCFFVDGYAGTGAVGIEALSRGARRVVFIEKHRTGLALIRRNLNELGITSGAEILPGDVVAGLDELTAQGEAADILFFDPPYAHEQEYGRVFGALADSALVAAHSVIIFEHENKFVLRDVRTLSDLAKGPEHHGRLVCTRTVTQGDAALDFFSLS
jgi:16S rRNA (guanine(966)-N(2))-methyltransferase RsmD